MCVASLTIFGEEVDDGVSLTVPVQVCQLRAAVHLPCYGSEVVADHCSWCTEPHTERREREREYRQKGQLKSLNETELSVADTSTCVQN